MIFYSLLTSVSILGLNNYIFIVNSGFLDHAKKRILWILLVTFKIISILIIISILFVSFFFESLLKYLDYALLVPLGLFLFNQQVALARKKYRKYLINLLIPTKIFILIIFGVKIFGENNFYLITIVILSIANIIFYRSFQLSQVYKFIFCAYRKEHYIRHKKHLILHGGNGLSLALISPLISLTLINSASSMDAPISEISSYYIYYRVLDGVVGFIISYFIVLRNENHNFYVKPKFIINVVGIILLGALVLNIAIYLATGFYSIYICIMEILIAITKLLLGLNAFKFLIRYPLLSSIRELLFYLFLLMVQLYFQPASIIQLQIYILCGYLISYLGSMIYINRDLSRGGI